MVLAILEGMSQSGLGDLLICPFLRKIERNVEFKKEG